MKPTFDIIGKMYLIDSTDQDNILSTELVGYHVNSAEEVIELKAFQVTPNTPSRVFAGAMTYFYVFNDEAEFTTICETEGWDI